MNGDDKNRATRSTNPEKVLSEQEAAFLMALASLMKTAEQRKALPAVSISPEQVGFMGNNGLIQALLGAFKPTERTVTLYPMRDENTLPHEFGHWVDQEYRSLEKPSAFFSRPSEVSEYRNYIGMPEEARADTLGMALMNLLLGQQNAASDVWLKKAQTVLNAASESSLPKRAYWKTYPSGY